MIYCLIYWIGFIVGVWTCTAYNKYIKDNNDPDDGRPKLVGG